MTMRRSLWKSVAFFMGFVNMSATLSAVRTNGTSSSKDSTMSRTRIEEVTPLHVLHAVMMLILSQAPQRSFERQSGGVPHQETRRITRFRS